MILHGDVTIQEIMNKANAGAVIGIDPDIRKSGVSVVRRCKIESLHMLTMLDLIAFIEAHKHQAVFLLEDVTANKPTFDRGFQPMRVKLAIAQKVGMVKGAAMVIEELLGQLRCCHLMVKPLQGRWKKAKDDAELFNQLTGWQGRSNQDTRDASIIALKGLELPRGWRLPK